MNLHQFRFIQQAVRNGLNLTEAAKALHTSQPGVSRAIIDLEQELGVQIFSRHGKRLRSVTEPGQLVLQSIEAIMAELNNLRRIGEEYSQQDSGTLSIATTHTQARYILPQPLARLRETFPDVNIVLHQGTPAQVAQMVRDETAQIGIATESLAEHDGLTTLPCYEWQHILVVPQQHPLGDKAGRNGRISLKKAADYPLVTYHPSFTGRTRIDAAFASAGLSPRVVLEGIDSDVIKTYVRSGLGVGIIAEMAFDSSADTDLTRLDCGHLFGTNTARLAFRSGAYMRHFALVFASYLMNDSMDAQTIQQTIFTGEAPPAHTPPPVPPGSAPPPV